MDLVQKKAQRLVNTKSLISEHLIYTRMTITAYSPSYEIEQYIK